jgi:hypothetical protein
VGRGGGAAAAAAAALVKFAFCCQKKRVRLLCVGKNSAPLTAQALSSVCVT